MATRAQLDKLRLLPWLVLGPLTGPLAWRMYVCARNGDRVLAAMYGVAIVALWLALGATSGQALAALAR
jgi:hypothetical protein